MSSGGSWITGLPADRMRMADRGRIHPGLKADITVMSPETIACRATLHEPNRYPDGISHVLVNGEVVIEGGKRVTGNHGWVIRHREP